MAKKRIELKPPRKVVKYEEDPRPARKMIKIMAGTENGWWIWALGKDSVGGLKKTVRYFLGCLPGDVPKEKVGAEARRLFPRFAGQMVIEKNK